MALSQFILWDPSFQAGNFPETTYYRSTQKGWGDTGGGERQENKQIRTKTWLVDWNSLTLIMPKRGYDIWIWQAERTVGVSNSQPATHGEVRGQAQVSVQVTRVTSTCHLFFEREPLTSLELHQAGRARGPQPPEGYLCLPPTSLMLGFMAHTAGILSGLEGSTLGSLCSHSMDFTDTALSSALLFYFFFFYQQEMEKSHNRFCKCSY